MDDLRDVIATACTGVEGLQAAVLFGSALTRENPHDLDVALLWAPELAPVERWRRAERIAAEVEHRLASRGFAVDVKDLREMSLVLQHRVLRDGVAVHVADRRALVRFTSETVPRALDFLPAHRRMLEAAARRVVRVGS